MLESSPRILRAGSHKDARGALAWWDEALVPFPIRRIYYATGSAGTHRGGHAHLVLEQVMVSLVGNLHITLISSDGKASDFVLDNPLVGLFVPANQWREISYVTDAVMLVLASMPFDEKDYVRSLGDFIS